MNTIKIDKKNTLMVAHRGCSKLELENSIPAFVAAGNRSYYGIETDVHVTADGKFVCIHDSMTSRVAGDDINVETSSFALVRKIILGNMGRDDLLIPRLEDYINTCKKYEKVAVLEVKNRMAPDVLARLVEEIKELDYLEHVIFISFYLENLIDLRNLLPDQKLQFLNSEYNQEVLDTLKRYGLDWDVNHRVLTKEIIDEVHAAGILVNTWTVDSPERAEELTSWGIDLITSNILE